MTILLGSMSIFIPDALCVINMLYIIVQALDLASRWKLGVADKLKCICGDTLLSKLSSSQGPYTALHWH